MYNLLIKNAKILDGISSQPQTGDVAVQNDQIVNVAERIDTAAETVIDATGKTLAPGFIDLQNHG
ncbi:MAG: D-aminoacylase, partial [Patescibacteria group bacterium]|nr:D-aminoacylase [Patescibacteria group bacterium]